MKKGKSPRVFSREFKLEAVRRMQAGDSPSAPARELDVRRKLLYEWKQRFEQGGEENLRSRGRPTRAQGAVVGSQDKSERRRIGELERLVGKQQALIDFFERALRRVGESSDGKARSGKRSEKCASERES